MLKMFRLCCIFFATVALLSLQAQSETSDRETRLQIIDVAFKFSEGLPLEKTYVLKSLSPGGTGIPEDYLRRLTSDVEAALLLATENKIKLKSRQVTDELWAEAIEFNSAKFDELYKNSSADVLLMLSPRITAEGVEIALSAYELTGDDTGNVIASSGVILLAMDVKSTLGVDVSGIDRKLDTVLEALEAGKPKPKTQEEIEQVLQNLGKQLAWFDDQFGLASSIFKNDSDWTSNYKIDDCYFQVRSIDGEIKEIKLTVAPPICDAHVGDLLVSQMVFRDIYALGRGQWQTDCVSCGNAYDPTMAYVIYGPHAAAWIDMKFETYEHPLYAIDGLQDQDGKGAFLRHLNSFAPQLNDLLKDEKIIYYSVGYGLYDDEAASNDVVQNQADATYAAIDAQSVANRMKPAFDAFDLKGRMAIKQGLKNFGVYSGEIDGNWDSSVLSGLASIVAFVAQYSPRNNFVVEYGLQADEISREDFLRFLNDLNCESNGLLKGTTACQ